VRIGCCLVCFSPIPPTFLCDSSLVAFQSLCQNQTLH
jgi:hypothetical protein